MSSPSDSYQEYPCDAALNPYVNCIWTSATAAGSVPTEHRVLPDGCIDIIFDLTEGTCREGKVVGTMTRPLVFQTSGPVNLVAVRFRPGGAVPLLRIPAQEITDLQCDLPRDWRNERIAERLTEEVDAVERTRLLQSALLKRLVDAPPVDKRVRLAVSMIEQRQSIETVAKKLDVSRQHLTRVFRSQVGIAPKIFARVDRLQRLLAHVHGCRHLDWSSVGINAGYFDQAHMINECRSLAGLTPTELCSR